MSLAHNRVGNEWSVLDITTGTPYTFGPDHQNYELLCQALHDQDAEAFVALFDVQKSVEHYVSASNDTIKLEVREDGVFLNGEPVRSSLVDRIMENMKAGVPYENMVAFLSNLLENPSYNSRQQAYAFLEHSFLPITDDGHLLAYKTVNSNYTDKYTGKVDNTPGGEPIGMPRSEVDDNPDNHCSKGYHVGALAYAGPGGSYNNTGDKVVICKVNPRDIVSVPNDFSCQKMRVCMYQVIGDFQAKLDKPCYAHDGAEIATKRHFMHVEDIEEGMAITFIDDEGEQRWGTVEELLYDDYDDGVQCLDTVQLEMYGRDEWAGSRLYFYASELNNIQEDE